MRERTALSAVSNDSLFYFKCIIIIVREFFQFFKISYPEIIPVKIDNGKSRKYTINPSVLQNITVHAVCHNNNKHRTCRSQDN